MKKNMKRLIRVIRSDSKNVVYLNTIEAKPSQFVKELYKIGRSLALKHETDLEIEEYYEDGRSDGSTYIYYEDVKNMVDDLETQIYNSSFYINSRGDFMSDDELYAYMEDAMKAQQTLYELTGIVYDCFADKE